MAGEINEKCISHAQEIKTLRERSHKMADEITALNLDAAEKFNDVQKQVATVSGELWRIAERIPEDLPARLLKLELMLTNLASNVESKFVTRNEFTVVLTEHEQLKKVVFGAISLAITAIAMSLIYHVVTGAK